jgi:hypothetical protein
MPMATRPAAQSHPRPCPGQSAPQEQYLPVGLRDLTRRIRVNDTPQALADQHRRESCLPVGSMKRASTSCRNTSSPRAGCGAMA